MDTTLITAVILILWNIAVFFAYGLDKRKAKKGKWRTPESVLIAMAFFMGGPGALLGMRVFHHKTRHAKFRIGVPLCIAANIAVIWLLIKK